MLRVNPAFILEKGQPKRSPRLVLALALTAAYSLLWTGCNTLPQSSAASSPASAQSISIQTALPNAGVGSSYHEILSVTGGSAPYHFVVSQGELPQGLVLNALTGSISGIPTRAGTFAFTIMVTGESFAAPGLRASMVTDEPSADSGLRAYTLTVDACVNCVTVQISPANPSIASGGKVQFAAVMSNTSNTAVTWSASAGSITTGGLFTAPSVKSAQSITVTAKNVAAEASVTGVVTPWSTRLAIATGSLPPGTAGTTYTTTLAASGGSQPYQWSVIAGSLPSGILLDSPTGVISGLTSKSGSYPFSVQITDATGANSSASLTLTMSSRGGTSCGPPSYPCSRSDTQLLVPTAPPHLGANPLYYGGHVGAGIVAADPVYNNNRILRVTDGNTDPLHPGESFATDSSAEKNETSYDESLFLVHAETGVCLFQYDAPSFSATYHGCFNNVGLEFDFGYTEADQRAFYSYYQEKLYRFVVNTSNWTIAPDPSFNGGLGYFDPDSASCLNGQIAANHWYIGDTALSSDDNTVIAAVGPEQDDNPYFVIWNAAKGCQWMNVQTWKVSQGWNTGLNNPVSIAWASGNTPTQQGGIHNAQLDRSGAYGVLTIHHVPSLTQKIFWTIGTNKVDDTCVLCTSHWASDFGVAFWGMGTGTGYDLQDQQIGSLVPTQDVNTVPVMGQWGNDVHLSHANATQGQKLIYLAAWQPGQGGSTVNQIWEDEITGINWDGSLRTIRFNKSWTSGYGFNSTARCSISRQGNYAICDSDYQMYNLDKGFGNGLNQDTCDHLVSSGVMGTNGCRTDLLLFELR
jgi:Putative Ig domain